MPSRITLITFLTPSVLIENHSPGPTYVYQQSFSWSHKGLWTIIALAPPMIMDHHISASTSDYEQSFFWLYQWLWTIWLWTIIFLAPPVIMNNRFSGSTPALMIWLFLAHHCLSIITLLLPSAYEFTSSGPPVFICNHSSDPPVLMN